MKNTLTCLMSLKENQLLNPGSPQRTWVRGCLTWPDSSQWEPGQSSVTMQKPCPLEMS